jgi:hypothetical protein
MRTSSSTLGGAGKRAGYRSAGRDLGIGYENATSYPAPGQVIVYPGGVSETEILLAYGPTRFASKAGQLAGNHFLTIRDDLDRLAQICRSVLWQGATPISLRVA